MRWNVRRHTEKPIRTWRKHVIACKKKLNNGLICTICTRYRTKAVTLHPRLAKSLININKKFYVLRQSKKEEIFGQYGKSNVDTGSAESQIALFSYRISHLTEHMKANRKDNTTERALVCMVGKRRALLNYLKNKDIERYRAIVKKLGLRK